MLGDSSEVAVLRQQLGVEIERALRDVHVGYGDRQAARTQMRAQGADAKPMRVIGAAESQVEQECFEMTSVPGAQFLAEQLGGDDRREPDALLIDRGGEAGPPAAGEMADEARSVNDERGHVTRRYRGL